MFRALFNIALYVFALIIVNIAQNVFLKHCGVSLPGAHITYL